MVDIIPESCLYSQVAFLLFFNVTTGFHWWRSRGRSLNQKYRVIRSSENWTNRVGNRTLNTVVPSFYIRSGRGKVQAHKIEGVSQHILRTLNGHRKSLSYQELLNICKLDTLECRKKQQSLFLLFKCIRNTGPKYITDFFSIRETSYNSRGNGVNLCVPKFHLNFMRNIFYIQVCSTLE